MWRELVFAVDVVATDQPRADLGLHGHHVWLLIHDIVRPSAVHPTLVA